MNLHRRLNILKLLGKKSFSLFEPRSTGKSTLIREQLADDAYILDQISAPDVDVLMKLKFTKQ